MTCSECGTAPVAAGQRYCYACGALLLQGAPRAPHAPHAPVGSLLGVTTPYVVGDGSDRAMGALSRQLTTEWLRSNKGRLVIYGGAAAVALAAVVMAVVAAIAWLVGLFAPAAVALFVLYLLVRPRRRRRRRRLMRIYRF